VAGLVVDQARIGRHLRLDLVGREEVQHGELGSGSGQVAQRVEVAGIHEVADQEERAAAPHPRRICARRRREPREALRARLGEEAEQLERSPLPAEWPHAG
jgi:hypothetical protein